MDEESGGAKPKSNLKNVSDKCDKSVLSASNTDTASDSKHSKNSDTVKTFCTRLRSHHKKNTNTLYFQITEATDSDSNSSYAQSELDEVFSQDDPKAVFSSRNAVSRSSPVEFDERQQHKAAEKNCHKRPRSGSCPRSVERSKIRKEFGNESNLTDKTDNIDSQNCTTVKNIHETESASQTYKNRSDLIIENILNAHETIFVATSKE